MADAIMERESQEVTIDDIAKFVESKARASSHPIFGNISDEVKDNRRTPKLFPNQITCQVSRLR